MNVFVNANGELRSGWKFATYSAIFLFVLLATVVLLSALLDGRLPADELTILWLNAISLFIPAAASLLLVGRFVEHQPVSTFGVGFYEKWRRDFLAGLGIAGGMLAILVIASLVAGDLNVRWTAGMASAGRLATTAGLLILAAANEELIFRGYPLQILMRGIGVWPAVLIMSAIFGALHMSNPNASHLGTANTVLAGIMLSMAYLRTRWLWLPYGIHIGWNAGLGFVLGFPLSGLDIASLWTTDVAGNDLVLGGGYGPEGGLIGTVIFIVSAIIVGRGFSK